MPFSSKLLVIALFLIPAVIGRTDPLDLLQKNHFIESIQEWDKAVQGKKMTEEKLRALKGQAVAYEKLGKLYKKFHEFFFVLLEEYYNAISKHIQSPTLMLYQGQIDYYDGNYSNAVKKMEKVIINKKASLREKDMAKVYRHYAMNKIRKKDLRLVFKSKFNDVKWQMVELDERLGVPKGLKAKGPRSERNKLNMLLRDKKAKDEDVQNSLDKILGFDNFAEIILNKGKLTQVNFYDPMMLQTLSHAFFYLSKAKNLDIIRNERKHPVLAKKFKTAYNLANAYYHLGRLEEAENLLQGDNSKKAYLLQARIKMKRKEPVQAKKTLANIARGNLSPAMKRDVGFAFFELGLDKQRALKLTGLAVSEKPISSYYQTYAAVLFGLGQKEKALEAYAKGYKIQFRNSIEHINPEYMVDYTFAIYRTSKMRYDEVVETLYHLQKAYPASRQMHYCMQGIAAAESRTFEGEKIFKKGG
ncbi:hypothetical protein ACFL5V_02210 [Fibrobacterota bacterium]